MNLHNDVELRTVPRTYTRGGWFQTVHVYGRDGTYLGRIETRRRRSDRGSGRSHVTYNAAGHMMLGREIDWLVATAHTPRDAA